MRQQDKYIALDWLKPAIKEACENIIKQISSLDDASCLDDVVSQIHQISGTLRLTELNEFLILTETLEDYCLFLVSHENCLDDARELLQAVAVLQFELDQFQTGKKHKFGALNQRINHLRMLMGKSALGDRTGHAVNFQSILPKMGTDKDVLAKESLDTLNQAWRQKTLEILKQDESGLDHLVSIADFMRKGSHDIPKAALWHVAAEWLSSLQMNKPLRANEFVHLLTKLNDNINKIQDAEHCELLITDILIQLLALPKQTEVAQSLVEEFSPKAGMQKSIRILDGAALGIHDAQAQFEKAPNQANQKLIEVKWLLEIGGWDVYIKFLDNIIEDLRNHNLSADNQKEQNISIKRQLNELYQAINNTKQLINQSQDTQDGAIQDAKNAVIREARINIEGIKNKFVTYCQSKSLTEFEGIDEPLVKVSGAFDMLQLPKAVNVVDQLQQFFSDVLQAKIEVLSWKAIDAIAESISSLEYYFDLLAQHYHDDQVLDKAEEAITLANACLAKNIETPLSKADVSGYQKVLPKDQVLYDDTSDMPTVSNQSYSLDDFETKLAPPSKEVADAVSAEMDIDLDDLSEFAEFQTAETTAQLSSGLVQDLFDVQLLEQTNEVARAMLLLKPDDFSQDIEIQEIYIEEADEVIAHITRYLADWQNDINDFASLTEIRRGFHTLKGSGRMVGAHQAGEVAWSVENMINRILDKTISVDESAIDFVTKIVSIMPYWVSDFAKHIPPSKNPLVAIVKANNIISNKPIDEGLQEAKVDLQAEQDTPTQIARALPTADFTFDSFELNADETSTTLTKVESATQSEAVDPKNTPAQQPVLSANQNQVQQGQTTSVASSADNRPKTSSNIAQETCDLDEQIDPVMQEWIEVVETPQKDNLEVDDDFREIFVEEAREVLEHITNKLPLWKADLLDKAQLADIRRGFHTLKGSGRMVGASKIGEFAWYIENMLNRVLDGAVLADENIFQIVHTSSVILPFLVDCFNQKQIDKTTIVPLMAVAKSYTHNQGIDPSYASRVALASVESVGQVGVDAKGTQESTSKPVAKLVSDTAAATESNLRADDAIDQTEINQGVQSDLVSEHEGGDFQENQASDSLAIDQANPSDELNFDLPNDDGELTQDGVIVESAMHHDNTKILQNNTAFESSTKSASDTGVFGELDQLDNLKFSEDALPVENNQKQEEVVSSSDAFSNTEEMAEVEDSNALAGDDICDDTSYDANDIVNAGQVVGGEQVVDDECLNESITNEKPDTEREIKQGTGVTEKDSGLETKEKAHVQSTAENNFDEFDESLVTDDEECLDGSNDQKSWATYLKESKDVASNKELDEIFNFDSDEDEKDSNQDVMGGQPTPFIGTTELSNQVPNKILSAFEKEDLEQNKDQLTDSALLEAEPAFEQVFSEEAQQLLAVIDEYVTQNSEGGEVSNDLVRAFHTLRGGSAMYAELKTLRDLNMSMELACRHLLENQMPLNAQQVELLSQLNQRAYEIVDEFTKNKPIKQKDTDDELIKCINEIVMSESDAPKIVVSDLIKLNIDDVLDAEWELEKKLLGDIDLDYIERISDQLGRLYEKVAHVEKLSGVIKYLQHFYDAIAKYAHLLDDDTVIDMMLIAHQNITVMFDALAASQPIECDDQLFNQLEEFNQWLDGQILKLAQVPQGNETTLKDQKPSLGVVESDTNDSQESAKKSQSETDETARTLVVIDSSETNREDENNQIPDHVLDKNQPAKDEYSSTAIEDDSNDDLEIVEDDSLLEIFLDEALEIQAKIDQAFSTWQTNQTDTDALSELQRYLHTIKGGARMVGLSSVGNLTHEAESIYELLCEERIQPSAELVRFMRHVQDTLATQIDMLISSGQSFHAQKELETLKAFSTSSEVGLISAFFTQKVPTQKAQSTPKGQSETLPTQNEQKAEPLSHLEETVNDSMNDKVPGFKASQKDKELEQQAANEIAPVDTQAHNLIDIKAIPAIPVRLNPSQWQNDEPEKEMLEIFLEEAGEIIDSSSILLHSWLADANDFEKLAALQRELHTLKGAARMSGVAALGDLAHEMEFIYEDLAYKRVKPNAQIAKVLSQVHDWLAEAHQVLTEGQDPQQAKVLIEALNAFKDNPDDFSTTQFCKTHDLQQVIHDHQAWQSIDGGLEATQKSDSEKTKTADTDKGIEKPALEVDDEPLAQESLKLTKTDRQLKSEPVSEEHITSEEGVSLESEVEDDNLVQPALELTKAVNLTALLTQQDTNITPQEVTLPLMQGNFPDEGDKQGPSQEQLRINADLMEKLINLSGEGAINRGRIEVSNTSLSNTIEEMGVTVQRLADQLRRMDVELEAQILAQYEGERGVHADFDPLEMDQYSALNQLSKSLSESASDLIDIKSTMIEKTRENEALLLQLSRVQTELQEGLKDSRLVPFSRLVPRLQRIARQTSNELGKQVELNFVNVDSEIDRTILDRITSPLEHMLRNSIDHGIEVPEKRHKANKPETGKIDIEINREGGEIVVSVSDDGKGIDLDVVRQKAKKHGLSVEDGISDSEIMQYIFSAGISTASEVTQISGRGVGMNVVQSEIKQLGGAVSVDSSEGKGSVFTMRLPLTVALVDALVVRVGERHFAIPLVQIERVERVNIGLIKDSYASSQNQLTINETTYRLRYLNQLLDGSGFSDMGHTSGSLPVIVVKMNADTKQSIQVDEIVGSRTEVVVKPLGVQLNKVLGVSSATIMGDGSVMLILDLLALLRNAPAERQVVETSKPKLVKDKTHVMVIDDSVTVRKVSTRLLERAGFEVSTAKDGIDALEKLQELRPDVMLLDIEMPRMDGFEVATHVRKEPELVDVPIIMITSRSGEKHRERAFELGVNCYMGKPFQEKDLLKNINELLHQTSLSLD